jgi:hypothetical protein
MTVKFDDNKDKAVYVFLEKNITPRIEKIIKEVNIYFNSKHNIQIGVDLKWIIQDLNEKESTND